MSPALFTRGTMWYSSALSPQAEAQRYSVMTMQAGNASMVATLHRYDPRLKIFMYQFTMFANPSDPNGWQDCTTVTQDQAHPSWFLKTASGADLKYGSSYALDVGNPAYQQACATHALSVARRLGFNGVFFDGVGAKLGYQFGGSATMTIPEYPTVASWQSAMYSFLTSVSATIHAGGLMVIGNIGGSIVTPGLWQKWNGPMDGAEEESWTDGGSGLDQQLPWWGQKLANVAWSEAHGKLTILHSFNTAESGNVFGLASMLLVAGGYSTYCTCNGNIVNYEAWYPEYNQAAHLGAPLGAYRQLPNGVYERQFVNGIVLVNPSSRGVSLFTPGGGPYSGSGLGGVTSVSMGPTSGLILVGRP